MCLSFQKHKNKIKVGACCFDIFCLLVEIREDTVWTGLIATPCRVCAQTHIYFLPQDSKQRSGTEAVKEISHFSACGPSRND